MKIKNGRQMFKKAECSDLGALLRKVAMLILNKQMHSFWIFSCLADTLGTSSLNIPFSSFSLQNPSITNIHLNLQCNLLFSLNNLFCFFKFFLENFFSNESVFDVDQRSFPPFHCPLRAKTDFEPPWPLCLVFTLVSLENISAALCFPTAWQTA